MQKTLNPVILPPSHISHQAAEPVVWTIRVLQAQEAGTQDKVFRVGEQRVDTNFARNNKTNYQYYILLD